MRHQLLAVPSLGLLTACAPDEEEATTAALDELLVSRRWQIGLAAEDMALRVLAGHPSRGLTLRNRPLDRPQPGG